MAESQILDVIRMWAAVAWADGVLAEPEADGLRRLIRSADLTPAEREAALGMVAQRVYLPDSLSAGTLSDDAKRGIYRAACRMAAMDRVFATAERVMLDRMRFQLQLADDVADALEREVIEPGLS
ncbi:MAG: hypothetical protein KF773_18095 [Deltaproteobacteria bacterium]|nr:hypothetical protein [Deltaproteobacteria bacterium]